MSVISVTATVCRFPGSEPGFPLPSAGFQALRLVSPAQSIGLPALCWVFPIIGYARFTGLTGFPLSQYSRVFTHQRVFTERDVCQSNIHRSLCENPRSAYCVSVEILESQQVLSPITLIRRSDKESKRIDNAKLQIEICSIGGRKETTNRRNR